MSKKKFILALDQGTSSSRAILFDSEGKVFASAQRELKQFYPRPSWVEQDADEIWSSTNTCIKDLLKAASLENIAAIGITNQRETSVVWEKSSGKPVHRAIVWQSRQSSDVCERLKKNNFEDELRAKTGLVIDPYFSASKLTWLFENNPALKQRAMNGELLFGTVDSWLIWNLTRGRSHITDPSNASRTLLYNIHKKGWDESLLNIFELTDKIMPEVVASSGPALAVCDKKLFGRDIPVCGIAGDQQAALFGQRCVMPGMIKNTYGTGCFMLMNTGKQVVHSSRGLLATVAWEINGKMDYALEGGVFIAGAAIKWLRDSLGIIDSANESEEHAASANSTEGVYLVPAFVGLGAPHWESAARAAIFGLTLGAGRKEIVRATLESMAYQSKDLILQMERDSGIKPPTLRVDGGACVNNFLMQFQADILGIPVERPANLETTAAGAAYLAGLGCGFWSESDLQKFALLESAFTPSMNAEIRDSLYSGWLKAVQAAIQFAASGT